MEKNKTASNSTPGGAKKSANTAKENTAEDNVTKGNAAKGNAAKGNTAEGNAAKGNTAEGNAAKDNTAKKRASPLSYPEYIPRRIRQLRLDHGLSQQTVASCLGISQQSYSSYERGASEMHIEHFERLAMLYDVSVDFITGASNLKGSFPEM